ncbi:MAG: hypothetical protein ACRD1Q_14470, partial [Vicinamibacterales bacterium]
MSQCIEPKYCSARSAFCLLFFVADWLSQTRYLERHVVKPEPGIVYYMAFLLSATAHEAAHAWAAKLGGDLTAYHGGQVSLDPR